MDCKGLVVAIDGPAGSGKSTVAKQLATRLDYLYIDSGAMYRCVGLKGRQEGLDLKDEELMADCAGRTRIELKWRDGSQTVFCDGQDVSEAIRAPESGEDASVVSEHPAVREILVRYQQLMGREGAVVMDGRDIGTVVFPDADLKFFLDARPEVRAQRRAFELRARGDEADIAQILDELRIRDQRDSSRSVGALKVADGAIVVDTSELSVGEVVEKLWNYCRKRLA